MAETVTVIENLTPHDMIGNVVNTTPHDIVIYNQDKTEIIKTYPRSGKEIRMESAEQEQLGTLNTEKVPVFEAQFFNKCDMRAAIELGSVFLVSMPVGQHFSTRSHYLPYTFLGPDTSPAAVVRDDQGRILGTTRLVYYGGSRSCLDEKK